MVDRASLRLISSIHTISPAHRTLVPRKPSRWFAALALVRVGLSGCADPAPQRQQPNEQITSPLPNASNTAISTSPPLHERYPSIAHYSSHRDAAYDAARRGRSDIVANVVVSAFSIEASTGGGLIDLEHGLIRPGVESDKPTHLSDVGAHLELIRLLFDGDLRHTVALIPSHPDRSSLAFALFDYVRTNPEMHPLRTVQGIHSTDRCPPDELRICLQDEGLEQHLFALLPRHTWRGCSLFDVSHHRGLAVRPIHGRRLRRYFRRRGIEQTAVECVYLHVPPPSEGASRTRSKDPEQFHPRDGAF